MATWHNETRQQLFSFNIGSMGKGENNVFSTKYNLETPYSVPAPLLSLNLFI